MGKNILKKVTSSLILCSLFACYTFPAFAYTNEESVFSKVNCNGEAYKTIVSTIEENENGKDISQNDVEKDLPIECKVTYKLDEEEMTADEIAGKKGKVTITLKYTNKDEKQVWINDHNEKMYTPFLVVSGVVLDNEKNRNIEINNGKLINNGETTIVAGFAIPGLIESLKLEDSDISVQDTIEISLETDCFELGNIMTFATPKVFSSLNIRMEDFNELFDKVNELQDASMKIEDGAKSLNDGIIVLDNGVTTLKEGSQSLNNGAATLRQGAKDLNDGAISLKNGMAEYTSKSKEFNQAVSQVSNGASQLNSKYSELNNGISTLNSSSAALENGAKSISEGTAVVSNNLNTISSKLATASESTTMLNSGAQSASEGINKIEF